MFKGPCARRNARPCVLQYCSTGISSLVGGGPYQALVVQVHLFIFYMAITHILGGILLIVLASLRMRFWRRWTEQADPISQE